MVFTSFLLSLLAAPVAVLSLEQLEKVLRILRLINMATWFGGVPVVSPLETPYHIPSELVIVSDRP